MGNFQSKLGNFFTIHITYPFSYFTYPSPSAICNECSSIILPNVPELRANWNSCAAELRLKVAPYANQLRPNLLKKVKVRPTLLKKVKVRQTLLLRVSE